MLLLILKTKILIASFITASKSIPLLVDISTTLWNISSLSWIVITWLFPSLARPYIEISSSRAVFILSVLLLVDRLPQFGTVGPHFPTSQASVR